MKFRQLGMNGKLDIRYIGLEIFKGVPPGMNKRTAVYTEKEVARLAAQGETTKRIAGILGLTTTRVRTVLGRAERAGYVDEYVEARDEYTKNMVRKMRDIAEEASDIIADRLEEIKQSEQFDARAMKDAFSSFDRATAVTGIDGSSKSKSGDKTVNIAIFSDNALAAAKEASGRIFDLENK